MHDRKLIIPLKIITQIHQHGEKAYPEEGTGFLLGSYSEKVRIVSAILPAANARESESRHNRYLINPQDALQAEMEADKIGLDIIGIFHSHPDHPNQPSAFDLNWALPWYSYIITSVKQGKAIESKSWVLLEDRSGFQEEAIIVIA
jgi:proteasome lid subunit RPN8/RPN11